MTIPAGTPNRNDYVGNDSLSIYSFTFPIQDETQLKVWVVNESTGTWKNGGNSDGSLIFDTDYTVQGEGNPTGGVIELVNNSQAWLDPNTGFLNTGWNIVIRMYPGLSQGTSFGNGGPMYEEALDALADTLTMQDLEQQDEIDRSIKIPPTENPANFSLIVPSAAERALTNLGFDSNGNVICSAFQAIPLLTGYAFASLPAQSSPMFAQCTDGPLAFYDTVLGSWQKVSLVGP
jgi:hypothetical protein